MSAPQFTPGPWQWVGDDEIEQAEHPFTSVAEVVRLPRNNDPDGSQHNANARLIAVAPAMYDMLTIAARTIEIFNETLKDHGEEQSEQAADVVLCIRAILAKARGAQ